MDLSVFRIILVVLVSAALYMTYQLLYIPRTEIQGWILPGLEEVRECYKELFDLGLDKGSSFVAFYRGELVAHLWGGCTNFWCSKRWQNDTVSQAHSSSKAIGALCLAVLVDRGYLNYSKSVASYWPEFAANGKSEITVEQLLSHQAGLAAIEDFIPVNELVSDWPSVVTRLANQRPLWKPGSEAHYHALTLGLYMEELFRRAHPQHQPLYQFFQEEIVKPLGLDLNIGFNKEELGERYAPPYGFSNLRMLLRPLLQNDIAIKQLYTIYLWPNATYSKIMSTFGGSSRALILNADTLAKLPLISSNLVGTALSLGRLFGQLAKKSNHSAVFPDRLLSPVVTRWLAEPLVDMSWMTSRKNFSFGRGTIPLLSPTGNWMIGSPGLGGQMAYADPTSEVAFVYLTNHLSPYTLANDPRHLALQKALYSALYNKTSESQSQDVTRCNMTP